MVQPAVQKHISETMAAKGFVIDTLQAIPVTGGSINETYKLTINQSQHYFLKLNTLHPFPDLFEKEKRGLEFLSANLVMTTPAVIDCCEAANQQFLLLEWIEAGDKNNSFWRKYGEQLAALHHKSHSQYGFYENNYMGIFLQNNDWKNNWCHFFIENRLLPQIQIATKNNRLDTKDIETFHQLFKILPSVFDDEKPCLLHGDLWSGNFLCTEQSEPVLIDPAIYFGHRSVDLGMTTLFGGFDRIFYEAYQYHFPLNKGHKEQWEIANLYPLLIHLNLFGESYLPGIRRTIGRYMHS